MPEDGQTELINNSLSDIEQLLGRRKKLKSTTEQDLDLKHNLGNAILTICQPNSRSKFRFIEDCKKFPSTRLCSADEP